MQGAHGILIWPHHFQRQGQVASLTTTVSCSSLHRMFPSQPVTSPSWPPKVDYVAPTNFLYESDIFQHLIFFHFKHPEKLKELETPMYLPSRCYNYVQNN